MVVMAKQLLAEKRSTRKQILTGHPTGKKKSTRYTGNIVLHNNMVAREATIRNTLAVHHIGGEKSTDRRQS